MACTFGSEPSGSHKSLITALFASLKTRLREAITPKTTALTHYPKILLTLLLFFPLNISNLYAKQLEQEEKLTFQIEYHALKGEIAKKIKGVTWKAGCPVNLSELLLLKISYWGFDKEPHQGKIIVHRKAAPEVLLIFKQLFENKFPIQSINLMHNYNGSDDDSMQANNTSAFNCRTTTNNKKVFSRHSYGIAIDINPLINPYVKKGKVLPPAGKQYINRDSKTKGLIIKDGICYKTFKNKGWKWGGDWHSLKDYQHFEKKLTAFKHDKKYSLTFKNLPKKAKIKIMNIRASYKKNGLLGRGLYDVKIIAKEQVKRFWIAIEENTSIDYLRSTDRELGLTHHLN